jgi:hypothetical protein
VDGGEETRDPEDGESRRSAPLTRNTPPHEAPDDGSASESKTPVDGEGDKPGGGLKEHLTLIAAAAASTFVTFRIIRAAHGSQETALELLQGETSSILIAAVAQLGPLVAAVTVMFVLLLRIETKDWLVTPWLVVPVVILAIVTAPLLLLLLGIITVVIGAVFARIKPGSEAPIALLGVTASAFLFVVVVLIVDDTVWKPTEALILDNDRGVIGYVREDGRWLRIVRDDDRTVQVVETADVVSRRVCARSDPPWWSVSIAGSIGRRPHHPPCFLYDR